MTFDQAMYEVLQDRRYTALRRQRPEAVREVTDSIWESIIRFLENLNLPNFFGADMGEGARAIALVFAVVGIILVIVAAFVLLRTFKQSRQEYELHDIFEELSNKKYTVNELINLSQTAENQRLAIRYRYIATLLALDERGIITISPSATNRIILQEIKNAAEHLTPFFVEVAEGFHRSWFGYKDVDFEEFVGAVSGIVSEVGRK